MVITYFKVILLFNYSLSLFHQTFEKLETLMYCQHTIFEDISMEDSLQSTY